MRLRLVLALLPLLAVVQGGAVGASPPAGYVGPSSAECAALIPPRVAPPTGTPNRRGDLRVVGIQYLQRLVNVVSYASFRTDIDCLFERYVVPYEVPGRPTLVVFNEDIGLMTGFVGARGAAARALLSTKAGAPLGDQAPEPAGALAAIGAISAAYAPQLAAYQARFGPIPATKGVFVAVTDTFVRAFMDTFSAAARDFRVYVVAANSQPRYRESWSAADIATFRDPAVTSGPAYVATSARVTNTAFLWGPADVHPNAPDGEHNLLFANEKVPLTSFESGSLFLDQGPTVGAAARINAAGYVVAGHRLGFATSLPAFEYGNALGTPVPAGDPCQHIAAEYMRCMDSLGVDTVIQAEANDGRWATDASSGAWQPLEWMQSSWRAVADPTVHFAYAVNPMMVGNLADIPFDGQSAIMARNGTTDTGRYVGDAALGGSDPPADAAYSGERPHFLALAPWVVPDGSRAMLAAESARLAPGSGDRQENDYLQTAVYADLLPVARSAVRSGSAPTGGHPTSMSGQLRELATTGGRGPYPALVLLAVLAAVRSSRARYARPASDR